MLVRTRLQDLWRRIETVIPAPVAGAVVTFAAVILIEQLRSFGVRIAEPTPILLLATAVAGTAWGRSSGLASAAIAILYGGLAYPADNRLLPITPDAGRVILLTLTTVPLAIITGLSHSRRIKAQSALGIATTRLQRVATRDGLTGLLNRRGFDQAVAAEISRSERRRRTFALVLTDIQGLSQINARQGRLTGDMVLQMFADALDEATRESDVAARSGDTEFTLLLSETDSAGADAVSRRIADQFARELGVGLPRASPVGADFGASVFPGDGVTYADLLVQADQRMREAKRGRLGPAMPA